MHHMLITNKIYKTIKEIKLPLGSGWGWLPDRYWEEGLSQGLCALPGEGDLTVLPAHLPERAGRCSELSTELGTALALDGIAESPALLQGCCAVFS